VPPTFIALIGQIFIDRGQYDTPSEIERLNVARAAWGIDGSALVKRAELPPHVVANALFGVGVMSDASDTKRLADMLQVYVQWLRCGDIGMVPL